MAGSGGQGKRPRESIDQAGRAVDLLCLDVQRVAHEFVRHRILRANFAQHVQVADNDREKIIEVMRKTAGELTDSLHLLRLAQLLALRLGFAGSVRSRMMPTKAWLPPCGDSPTASSIGKVEPSLRRPITSRPMPMMRGMPVSK